MILVKGDQLERFLNLCKNRNICMERIHYTDDMQLTARIRAEDFLHLRPIRSKTGVHITIIQKYGMPFFFFRNKKRKAFFAGMIMGSILIVFMAGRIWNIHIEGNIRNSTGEILNFLEEQEAARIFCQYEKKLLQNGAKITENHVQTKVSGQMCITRGTLQIVEKAGEESAIYEKSRPDEVAAKNE